MTAPPSEPAELLDVVQRQTLRYFLDFAHPGSGMSRERITIGAEPGDLVATGATGFGVMAILAGTARGWILRRDALERLLMLTRWLAQADSHHGVYPHWMDGRTGATIPFSPQDDGGDLVETAFLMQGLLCARQFFDGADAGETELRERIDGLWRRVEWSWHLRGGQDALYWHWSPNHGWAMNMPVRGWNECLIAYVLAASSPIHPIGPEPYHRGWAGGPSFRNGRDYDGVRLPLGPDLGGPLFFTQYSFVGLDPRGLDDRYADYWVQNVAHARLNWAHCVRNPNGFEGYGPACWGLSADDTDTGYREMSPTADFGFIAPNAAIASLPYLPEEAASALDTFYHRLGGTLWGPCGFTSSFSESRDWFSRDYIGIDQGPTVAMIENHRSALLWRLFMSCPEVQAGLTRLDFASPHLPSRRPSA